MIGPEKSFCSLVDEAILRRAAEPRVEEFYPLRPSAAGYCSRKLAHELMAYSGFAEKKEEFKKPSVHRLLNLGHSIEYHALKQIEQIEGFKVKFKQQVVSLFTLPSGRIIEGSVDAVLWSEKERGVLDVKSVGNGWSAAFGSRWEQDHARLGNLDSVYQFDHEGYFIEDPMQFIHEVGEHTLVANIKQINGYALSSFMQERGINFGSVYRYEKNSSKHVEIRFKLSQELFDQLKEKYSTIETQVALKKPLAVKKDYVLGSMACAYCPYQQDCWGETTKREVFASFPDKKWATGINELSREEDRSDVQPLKNMFSTYLACSEAVKAGDVLEQRILTELEALQVKKVKLDTGEVFEVVALKSPKPHLELRRSKE